jgi:AraC-like DNA-binding protein
MQKDHRLFVNFSIPFLLFIIIPVFILNVATWQAIQIIEHSERQNCVNRLSLGKEKMDNQIKNIHTTVTLLRTDNYLHNLENLSSTISAKHRYDIWLALRSINKMDLAAQDLNPMIYYRNSDLVLTPTFLAGIMKNSYGTLFRFGSSSYSEFLNTFNVSGTQPIFFPAMDYTWDNTAHRGVLYGMRMQIAGSSLLFFLLHEKDILKNFSPIFSGEGGLYIYEPGGNLIYSYGGSLPSANLSTFYFTGSGFLDSNSFGPGVIAAYSRSDYGPLYVSIFGKDAVLNRVQNLRNLTFYLNITAIFLSLGYAVFLAARNSKQIAKTVQLLGETTNLPAYKGGNAMRYLNTSVVNLINTNTSLRDDINLRKDILKAAFLDHIFSGSWENHDEPMIIAEQAGISLAKKFFCVVFLILKSGEFIPREKKTSQKIFETDSILGTVKQEILAAMKKALTAGDVLFYSRNPSYMTILFILNTEQKLDFRKYIEVTFQSSVTPICLERNITLRIVASGFYDDLFKIREGYNLCREYALTCSDWDQADIHWIDTLSKLRQRVFVFPLEAEQKLINQLQNADFAGIKNSLHSIFSANLHENLLNEKMLTFFYVTLQGCFLRSLEGHMAELYHDIIQDKDFSLLPPPEVEDEFVDLAQRICHSFTLEYSKKTATIKKEDLIAYVEDHFSEDRLSLRLAAKHFGFSETYFSQMFKEITGENYSTFTEITRLNHAHMLLKQRLKVEETAYRCGYRSPNSFRRAYKRYFGISPSQTS